MNNTGLQNVTVKYYVAFWVCVCVWTCACVCVCTFAPFKDESNLLSLFLNQKRTFNFINFLHESVSHILVVDLLIKDEQIFLCQII